MPTLDNLNVVVEVRQSLFCPFFWGVPNRRRVNDWQRRSSGGYNTRYDIFDTLGRGQLRPPPHPIKPTSGHAWYSMVRSGSKIPYRLAIGSSLCPRADLLGEVLVRFVIGQLCL